MRLLLPLILAGFWLLPVAYSAESPRPLPSAAPTAVALPQIRSLLKPKVYERVMDDREVMVHAKLDDLPTASGAPQLKHYEFYAVMLAHAPLKRVRAVMTDYALYSKMVPYIDKTVYDERTKLLDIEGGIFKFRLKSRAHFEEIGDRALDYKIVSGHFTGLSGRMFFEDAGEKGTLVYWTGTLDGSTWPPAFIVERGAEIVFGFTGKRMRSYIEHEYKDSGKPESRADSTR